MNVKPLLCVAAMLSAYGVAQAFPDYTLSPASGSSFNSNLSLANFNLSFKDAKEIVVDDNAMAILMNEDGDDIYSTSFAEFQLEPGTIIIKFDSDEIQINGQWDLTIPAGSITVDGEESPAINASYTLSDPNLGLGEFPQIELLSTNPADGDKLHLWGGDAFDRVDLKTSDDDAVNYIEWKLWDVTNGEEEGVREWLKQGNDNRFDLNRYGHTDDIWVDGLYIAVGGSEKLVEGHKYRLDLRFCGIGYDVETDQYPSDYQIELSTECEASVYYYGLTEAPEYSPYTYEAVSPNPDEYVITSPELGRFMITYSGPVKPLKFTYPLGMGAGTAPAGEFAPAMGNEVDADGCASVWEFVFDESILTSNVGNITCNIETIDKDGLYVKGNADYLFDNNTYSINWICNCGAPALMSIDPIDGSEVEELSSITVTNEDGQVMNLSYVAGTDVIIVDRFGSTVRTLGEPAFSVDNTNATWTFDPIVEEGTYALIIPMYYFNMGEEFSGTNSNATTFTYIVKGNSTPSEAAYDLLPVSITPEDNSELSSLSMIQLNFSDVTYCPLDFDGTYPQIQLLSDGEILQEINPVDLPANDFFDPDEYYISFSEVAEIGNYTVIIPQGIFFDRAYDESNGAQGHANPEIELNYVVAGTGVEAIFGADTLINVYDMNGVMILNNANVEAAKELKAGVYVINGKKVIVRK